MLGRAMFCVGFVVATAGLFENVAEACGRCRRICCICGTRSGGGSPNAGQAGGNFNLGGGGNGAAGGTPTPISLKPAEAAVIHQMRANEANAEAGVVGGAASPELMVLNKKLDTLHTRLGISPDANDPESAFLASLTGMILKDLAFEVRDNVREKLKAKLDIKPNVGDKANDDLKTLMLGIKDDISKLSKNNEETAKQVKDLSDNLAAKITAAVKADKGLQDALKAAVKP